MLQLAPAPVLVALAPLLTLAAAMRAAQEAREAPAQELLLPGELARAEDATDSGLAFVELVAARDTYLVGEPFRLRLRFGFERDCLRGLVQLFPRPLDVPAQVFAPALELLDGARFLDTGDVAGDPPTGASFALDERITRATRAADEERAGRTYGVFEYERALAATRPGALVLSAPLLGFAYATSFEEDFVVGSVPLDRRDVLVRGSAARITIVPLPEEGRPPGFTGAVGRFTIRAAAEPRTLEQGQSLKLTVVVEGEGDLSNSEPPDLAGLDGFHLQGSLVERGAARLTTIHDLVARDGSVRGVPPVRFAFFDTTPPAGYRTIETEPIPIVVRAPAALALPESSEDAGARGSSVARRLTPWILLVVVLALVLWWRARRLA